MNRPLDDILTHINDAYRENLQEGSRFYLEVSLARAAETLGYGEFKDICKVHNAIVPLKRPVPGMKVRIDGRSFINYAQFDSGVAIPEYLAAYSSLPRKKFIPNDSMVLNCA